MFHDSAGPKRREREPPPSGSQELIKKQRKRVATAPQMIQERDLQGKVRQRIVFPGDSDYDDTKEDEVDYSREPVIYSTDDTIPPSTNSSKEEETTTTASQDDWYTCELCGNVLPRQAQCPRYHTPPSSQQPTNLTPEKQKGLQSPKATTPEPSPPPPHAASQPLFTEQADDVLYYDETYFCSVCGAWTGQHAQCQMLHREDYTQEDEVGGG